MEKHKCKLCLRNFSNGRALGGHMRSHMMNLPVPPKPNEFPTVQLSFEAESSPSQSSSSFEHDKGLSYGLRENPKRNFRFTDPEFSFAADTGSVILQDRESETESSKNPTRRRSKRAWQIGELEKNKMKLCCSKNESASSVSDTTTEEDVAFCLMMLSRDNKWKKRKQEIEEEDEDVEEEEEQEEEDEEEEEDSYDLEELKFSKKTNRVRGRYKCETCNKVFRSYQALGGHRASHKKINLITMRNNEAKAEVELEHGNNNNNNNINVEKKIHECPVCFRVFASGQALGGHKRTHVIGSASASVRTSTKFGESLIDLNLPAPMDDDDDVSQFDYSAVSDAEFVKSH